jgi:photosystem II PsbU protein
MMKRFMNLGLRLFNLFLVVLVSLTLLSQPVVAGRISIQPVRLLAVDTELPTVGREGLCEEFGEKIDLNNANLVAFMDCQGFYPQLAQKIVENSPYQKVEDVLGIPELSDRQKELLKSNLDHFKVSGPVVSLEKRMPPRPALRK